MGFRKDFRPIETMIGAGLDLEVANALVREFANTSMRRQRAMLQRAVRSAVTISNLVIKTANKESITLDPEAVTAFCQIVSDYDDPNIRRLLATLTGKQKWHRGIPLLGYLLSDDDAAVKRSAELSLGKLDDSLLRVLTSGKVAEVTSAAELSSGGSIGEFGTFEFGQDQITQIPAPSGEISVQETAAVEPSGATIRRYTQVDYTADAEKPRRGEIALTLKLKPNDTATKTVDIRVRKGKVAASLVVHASSPEFKVTPEIQRIEVPRNNDSETARFAVSVNGAAVGNVRLTIFDEARLVGSVRVNMEAVTEKGVLTLCKRAIEVFRDAGSSVDKPGFGITIQLSLADGAGGHINFHTLGKDESGQLEFFPLGSSPQGLQAAGLQDGLSTFRRQVQEISDNLLEPNTIGASSREDAFKALDIKFDGLGKMIYTNLLSVGVRTILNNRAPETTVHWVVKDDLLDIIPWEFAFQKSDSLRIGEPPLLVRVPVWVDANDLESLPSDQDGARGKKVAYVLGAGVATLPAQLQNLLTVLRGASAKKLQLKSNFSKDGLNEISITTACDFIGDAGIVHMLCHGVNSGDKGTYLQLTPRSLGHVTPSDVYAWKFRGHPLVFVNACSSGGGGISAAGFTTFGKSFLHAGASVYIGTLAPIVTETAMKIATEFFDALLGEGLSVADAMIRVRTSMRASVDPTWRLYSIYADLQAAQSLTP